VTEHVAIDYVRSQDGPEKEVTFQVFKSSLLLLLGLLSAGATLSCGRAYGQLDKQYRKQEDSNQRCKRDWWPNAEFKHVSSWPDSRMLVRNNEVFIISFEDKCSAEFIGFIGKDYNYSSNMITNFSIEAGALVEYYKNPNKTMVSKRVHTRLTPLEKMGKTIKNNAAINRRGWAPR